MGAGMVIFNGVSVYALPFLFFSLLFWRAFGLGRYSGAAIDGIVRNEEEFFPIDWIMAKTKLTGKCWGTVAMILRMSLIMAVAVVLTLFDWNMWHLFNGVVIFPLMGISYYLAGLQKRFDPITVAEIMSGFMVGFL